MPPTTLKLSLVCLVRLVEVPSFFTSALASLTASTTRKQKSTQAQDSN